MALKDVWVDLGNIVPGLPDSGDAISADEINEIAHAVIQVENNKAETDLSNVSNETFKAKADAAGVGGGGGGGSVSDTFIVTGQFTEDDEGIIQDSFSASIEEILSHKDETVILDMHHSDGNPYIERFYLYQYFDSEEYGYFLNFKRLKDYGGLSELSYDTLYCNNGSWDFYKGLFSDYYARKDELEDFTTKEEAGSIAGEVVNGYVNYVEEYFAHKATTLSGYGITDAYTKGEVNSLVGDIEMALDEKADMLEFATDLLNVHKIEDSGNYPFKALLLQGAVENPTIRVYGKNLIKPEFSTDSQYTFIEGKNIAFANTVSSSVYPTIRLNQALPTGTYRLSLNVKTPPTVGTVLVYVQGKGGGYSNVMTIPTSTGSVSKTFETDILQIMFVVRANDTFEISDLQLEVGNVATEYKPYVEPQIVNIPYTYADGDSLTVENGAVKNNISGIEEDITNTQTGQALLVLHTNYPSTTIVCDVDCKLAYKADTTNAFKKLNGELDTLKQAIINLGGTI